MVKRNAKIILSIVIGIVVVLSGRWIVSSFRQQRAELSTIVALRQLGLALHNYTGLMGKGPLPSAFIKDAAGKPGLSWRVLLLPIFGEFELYEKFHLDEPWDSPANLPLAKEMPSFYRSLFCDRCDDGFTSFRIVVDPESAFPDHVSPIAFKDITDGLSNTLFIVELPEMPQVWTQPDTLSRQEVESTLRERKWGQRLIVSFLDGDCHTFASYVGDKTFDAFCSRAGNDVLYPGDVPGRIKN